MALNLPPIPNGPISETPIWRSWFTRLQSVLTTTTPGSVPVNHNALSSIQGGSALERYHLASSDVSKLAGIEAGAEVNNISDINATDLTDGGNTTLHTHSIYLTVAASKFPFYNSSSVLDTISLNTDGTFPFFDSTGAVDNIPMTT